MRLIPHNSNFLPLLPQEKVLEIGIIDITILIEHKICIIFLSNLDLSKINTT